MMFWIMVAVMIAVALLFVVPPLLGRGKGRDETASRSELNLSVYRDQLRELESELAAGSLSKEQYQSARSELEGRVLEDSTADTGTAAPPPASGRKLAIASAIAIPLLTVSLYLMLGKPGDVDVQSKPPEASQEVTQEQILAMVEGLAKKLKEKPNDAEGWVMLGRSYFALRRYNDAAEAYGRAADLLPNNAQILADYADILAMSSGRSMLGEPEKIIRKALQIDPNNMKAVALMGTAHFQRKEYAAAVEWWQKLLDMLPPDSPVAASIKANISQAQGLGGQAMSPPAAPGGAKQAAGSASGSVSGSVALDPSLKSRVSDTDTVFIFARDADQPRRPPLAILRKTVKDLPLDFTLDDSMAIMPNFKLSSASSVVVGARISKTGNATPSPGDLEGLSKPVKAGEKGIGIRISSVVN